MRRRFELPVPAEVLGALALVSLYLAVTSGHLQSIDGLVMWRQAVAIVQQHSLHWSPPILWGQTRTTSNYGIGLSLLYLPAVLVWSALGIKAPVPGGQQYDFALLYTDRLYALAGVPVQILTAVAGAYLVARLVRELGYGTRAALWGLVLYGVGSPAIVFSRSDASQPLEGLCWIAAIYCMVRLRKSGRSGWLMAALGVLIVAVLTRPLEGSLLFPALLLLTAPHRRFWRWPIAAWKTTGLVGGAYLISVLATLAVNWGRFGSPLDFNSGSGWATPLPVGLAGALVSPGRGIIWAFPAVLLAPLGLRALWQAGERRLSATMCFLIGALLLNVSLWTWWWGGWSWGLRLFLPALPLLAVFSAIGVATLHGAARMWLPALLLLGGIVWAVPCIVTDILGGYGGVYSGSAVSFNLQAYPPIGAWTYFHHWRAVYFADSGAADILWLRAARITANLSLMAPVVFGLASLLLFRRAASPDRISSSHRLRMHGARA